jgi:2,3-bisphosphoglycerate-dependent phosphoglycerate mutase
MGNRTLVLVRHGQSEWNLKNLFTGWRDVDLTEVGIQEARTAGKKLKAQGLHFDIGFTSALIRAQRSLDLVLDEMGQKNIPVIKNRALNERDYGDLSGLNKDDARAKWGEEQVHIWRRSYDVPPPPLPDDDPLSQAADPRYAQLPDELLPRTECLRDVVTRLLPYWQDQIIADLAAGRTVLVAAHGNSLRALVKHLDDISDADIAELNIPTGMPLVYELDERFRPVTRGGRYLDPQAAEVAAEAVRSQGR